MRELDFQSLRETLLRGGVAPKHVRRTIAELRDHHTDLFSEALSKGSSFEDAESEASTRLGDVNVVAAEVLARPELRSWTHRWPWLAYCATPTLVLGASFVSVLFLLGFSDAVRMDRDTFTERWGSPDSPWSIAGAIRLFYSFGLPVLVAGTCCVAAVQRRVPLRWPLIGVITAAIVGGATQFNVIWPHGPEVAGSLSASISVPPFPGSGGTVLRAVATCALTLAPLLWWRKRVART
jgi:hypothetical protein